MLRLLASSSTIAILCATAHADPEPFRHQPGVTAGLSVMHGANTDDAAVDFDHGQYGALLLGYRFWTGTELYALAGVSPNTGHESLALTGGAGVRQRIRLGPTEPFVEAGYFYVGDEADTPWAIGVGGGVDWRLSSSLAVGVAAGRYVSDDSDERGALDWYGRAQLTWRIGR